MKRCILEEAFIAVYTGAAVTVQGLLDAFWPPHYEAYDVPDSWLDEYEAENEVLESSAVMGSAGSGGDGESVPPSPPPSNNHSRWDALEEGSR